MSSHYIQAYMNPPNARGWGNKSFPPGPYFTKNSTPESTGGQNQPNSFPPTSATWYQPGNSKCTFKGCNFTASYKTLEIHMMDRHLIYPPRWEKKQKKHDWDADPSLKGKPIPIQGTTLILDSPTAVEAWISERKKRWPTSSRVDEKKRKMEEAIARGQLSVGENSLRKRRRVDIPCSIGHTSERDRHSTNTSNQVRRRGRRYGTDSGWGGKVDALTLKHNPQYVTPASLCPDSSTAIVATHSDKETESDMEPDIMSTKEPLGSTRTLTSVNSYADRNSSGGPTLEQTTIHPDVHKIRNVRPVKKGPYNPFASRPTLLRNLLLPEIHITISNLSQALRFLGDNSFLRGVEQKVGESDEKMIEVISNR
ncbi:hypothetical protein BDZ94DRAFT_1265215 [Collybia nuda]|uniref:FMR1-interacting protein 1 conserved domain-containing protein n=1 Tax=Collybia nuda TaxID=64659 RepID=A0A9P5Y1Z2_9AGAR|nr:hypothetical protein BDZ94DRAFT_1265215 [Collybia nuda]